jgi:Flp pilus assembly pilin Flp
MPNLKNRKGQGLVEYILIVALMGILAIGAIKQLSSNTRSGFTKASTALSNEFDKIGG